MEKDSKIYVAGHRGLAGSAIVDKLKSRGYKNILTRTSKELDLRNQKATEDFFHLEKPDYVFLTAAKVGGVMANNKLRASFIYDNIMIQTNVIHNSYLNQVKKLMFLGSTCVYPKESSQPMKENYLLTSDLEYTNEPYAIAKIAGIKMCESYNIQHNTNYICVMPTNLYGKNDNFDLDGSHVLSALLRKFHLAKLLSENKYQEIIDDIKTGLNNKEIRDYLSKFGINKESVQVWGTGKPKRDFLSSQDMADACIFIMENKNFSDLFDPEDKQIKNTHINIGTGKEVSIYELSVLIKRIVGFEGSVVFDDKKPDGTLRKLTDTSRLDEWGWKYKTSLEDGIKEMYKWYLDR
ncbi:GDP-L-fucose synthase family protein [Ichthyobacterium seriolicida]|nr:GDP-L-fucose synthase [Ichthyobacterium seriolicida]